MFTQLSTIGITLVNYYGIHYGTQIYQGTTREK